MRRVIICVCLLFFSIFCFAQEKSHFKVIGRIPDTGDNKMYQIQVGAFINFQNAERTFNRLTNAAFTPAYEKYLQFTRVVINGVDAKYVPVFLKLIQNLGFTEVIIRIDNGSPAVQVAKKWESLTEDVQNLIPLNILEEIEDLGIEINNGRNPPNIEGTYLVSTLQLVKSTAGRNISTQWDKYVTFSGQDNTTLTINADYTMQTSNGRGPMSSKGTGSFIVGEGNKFSVIVDGTREEGGYTAKTVEIFSGEISDAGIINYHWAVMMIDNSGNPLNIWINNKTGYSKKDSDGFSERVY